MDATCAIQNSIHVFSLVHINMCPGFWVHISAGHTVFIIKIPGFQYEHKSGVKAGCENEIL